MSRREMGFWPLLWRHRRAVLGGPEFVWALVVAMPGGFLAAIHLTQDARADAAALFLVVAAALLAVVFTAMAILVAVASNDLLVLVEDALDDGVSDLAYPFVIGTGLQVMSLLTTGGYLIVGPQLIAVAEEAWFGAALFLTVFALLDLVALARFVADLTRIRGRLAHQQQARGTVTTLPPRANGQNG